MSNRPHRRQWHPRPGWADQADAARNHLERNLTRSGIERAKGKRLPAPLDQLAARAFDAAVADPDRCCPHIDVDRPSIWMLDVWRRLLSCGHCRRSDQLVPLPEPEEHACDWCRGPLSDDWTPVVFTIDFVLAAVALCDQCRGRVAGEKASTP